MGLRDLTIPTATVQVADESFIVRGLSPNDALGLYSRHAGQLSALFDEFSGKVKAEQPVEANDFGAALLGGAPRLLAEVIAIANGGDPGRPEEWEADVAQALRFPAGVQMDALQKVADLTFSSDMPPPKFFGLVLALAQSATAQLQSAGLKISATGSGDSESR
jgi:hypothetical protein